VKVMSWKSEVGQVVNKICPIGGIFSLSDIYDYNDYFRKLYPNNSHIEDKIRQTLQYLRDDGILDFIENHGEYKRLK
jgi:hypothetical protein